MQWLKLKFPIPLGNSGGSPGFAIIGISNGFKLKRVAKDFLIYALLSKKIVALWLESFFAISISFSVATSCTPLIS